MGPGPRELGRRNLGTRNTHQSLKVGPGNPLSLKAGPQDPLQNLKVGSQDPLQGLKVGPPHLLMNSFFSEHFFAFFTYLFLCLF